jgi:hypothetical protein
MSKKISSFLFEIRFVPSPSILDRKGQIVESLADDILSEWSISLDEKIQISSRKLKYFRAVVTVGAIALEYKNCPSLENFLELSKEFLKKSWTVFPFSKIVRMGIRSTYLTEINDFGNTVSAYKGFFLKPSDEEMKKLGGNLIDIGVPLNFSEDDHFFNIVTGPMPKAQMKERMGLDLADEELPEIGMYVDVDYFSKEISSQLKQKDVVTFFENGLKKAEQINNTVQEWVLPTNV